ncbi:MAG: hypothetical protein VB861_12805, partial [Planctomycetaceae bacterium]
LPGMAHSRPFRSLGFAGNGLKSIEDTILRSLPVDKARHQQVGWLEGRRLFQLGTLSQHVDGVYPANGNDPVTGQAEDVYKDDRIDYTTRHRLLSKIHGNTTNHSNVFFVFTQIDWFEAHVDDSNGHVRIGSKLKGGPSHRAFMVVDRTRALELVQSSHIPAGGSYSIGHGPGATSSLDLRQLILRQGVIE